MAAPKIRLACCLCGKSLPQKAKVYPLDAEWRRRNPNMVGMLACRCAIGGDRHWWCKEIQGKRPEGHIPADSTIPCMDSWSHLEVACTMAAAVTIYPDSALAQGAEEYLRHTANRRGQTKDVATHLQVALTRWDARASTPR